MYDTPKREGDHAGEGRKAFAHPQLDELGSLDALTQGLNTQSNEDAVLGPNQPPNPPNTFEPPPPDPS